MDNLMLVGAIEASGTPIIVKATPNDEHRFTDLSAFEECLKLAAAAKLEDMRRRRAPVN